MNITKLNCTACGAPISIPGDLELITCSSCGTSLRIERGEGYIALKVSEKITNAIQESGQATQDVIRESTHVTRNEFQRLQQAQEMSAAQMQLSNIQAEIRTLVRERASPTSQRQLISLHGSEYLEMEHIRNLRTRKDSPNLEDLQARLELSEWELGWISSEIAALSQSNHPQQHQLLASLTARKEELNYIIFGLKIQVLRSKLPSFNRPDPPMDDPVQILAVLDLLDKDEKKLRDLSHIPEARPLHQEIMSRQNKLRETWRQLESKRISDTLIYTGFRVDFENPASLTEYLGCIDQDLQNLTHEPGNYVVSELHTRLGKERERTLKQIRKLQKAAENAGKTGFLSVITAGVAGFFGGLALLFNRIFSGSKVQPAASATLHPEVIGMPAMGVAVAESTGLGGKAILKPVGLGCLVGLLTLVIISVCSVIPIALLSPSNPTFNKLSGGIFLIIVAIGFLLGSWAFFSRAAPGTSIHGLGGMKDILIAPKKAGMVIRSLRVVKLLVGAVTWVSVYLIFLALMLFFQNSTSAVVTILVLLGLVLGPLTAWLVGRRTSMAMPEEMQ
jgi:hypothetical protein